MKTKEDILFKCWHESNDTAPTNETILKAMTEFAKEYHKKQLKLCGVTERLYTYDEVLKVFVNFTEEINTNRFFTDGEELKKELDPYIKQQIRVTLNVR